MNALDIYGVTYSYGNGTENALEDFFLSVANGRMHALLGPNGAGKSTLMRIATGRLRDYSGSISVYGRMMPDREALLSIGYVPQPISLYTGLTATENLRFFGAMAGMPGDRIEARSREVLEQTGEPTVGIDPQSRHHIYETLTELNAAGMTVLLSTHIMEEAQRLCQAVTMADRGRVIYEGPMSEIDNLEKFFLEKTGRGLRDD